MHDASMRVSEMFATTSGLDPRFSGRAGVLSSAHHLTTVAVIGGMWAQCSCGFAEEYFDEPPEACPVFLESVDFVSESARIHAALVRVIERGMRERARLETVLASERS